MINFFYYNILNREESKLHELIDSLGMSQLQVQSTITRPGADESKLHELIDSLGMSQLQSTRLKIELISIINQAKNIGSLTIRHIAEGKALMATSTK